MKVPVGVYTRPTGTDEVQGRIWRGSRAGEHQIGGMSEDGRSQCAEPMGGARDVSVSGQKTQARAVESIVAKESTANQ
jgi:hypothetical protein